MWNRTPGCVTTALIRVIVDRCGTECVNYEKTDAMELNKNHSNASLLKRPTAHFFFLEDSNHYVSA